MPFLFRPTYPNGRQYPKAQWLCNHRPELRQPPAEAAEKRLAEKLRKRGYGV